MKSITSNKNPLYRTWQDLLSSAGIKKNKLHLASGAKLIPERLRQNSDGCEAVIFPPGPISIDWAKLTQKVPAYQLTQELFNELDILGTKSPLLVCHNPEMSLVDLNTEPEGLEVWSALGDPSNLGALLRSAEAFSIDRVVLLKESANPFLPRTVRASAGSVWRVPLLLGPSIQELQTAQAHSFVVLDKSGSDLQKFSWPKNLRLLLGEEGRGIPPALSTAAPNKLSISINKNVESLNALVAASISFYAYRSAHRE